jgi:hypothetical protein
VIRVTRGDEPPVDVIAGRSDWQAAFVGRADRADVAGVDVRIAAPADIVRLEPYAGEPQDAWGRRPAAGCRARDRSARRR